MNAIPEACSRILQRAIDRGYLGLDADDSGEYTFARLCGTDDELAALCEVGSLVELRCMESEITDASFAKIASLAKLRVLSVTFTRITGRAFPVIETLPKLEELHCNPREETKLAAQCISRCKSLRVLDVAAGHFTDAEVGLFFRPVLEKFSCEISHRLTDEAFAGIGSACHLAHLCATDLPIGDKTCEYLMQCPNLRHVNLGATQITDGGVASLSRCAPIEELWLGSTRISAASIRTLANLPALHILSITECAIGDDSLEDFAALPALHTLWVDGTRFTKNGLKQLYDQRRWEHFSPRPRTRGR